jgi:hypothetical protein
MRAPSLGAIGSRDIERFESGWNVRSLWHVREPTPLREIGSLRLDMSYAATEKLEKRWV